MACNSRTALRLESPSTFGWSGVLHFPISIWASALVMEIAPHKERETLWQGQGHWTLGLTSRSNDLFLFASTDWSATSHCDRLQSSALTRKAQIEKTEKSLGIRTTNYSVDYGVIFETNGQKHSKNPWSSAHVPRFCYWVKNVCRKTTLFTREQSWKRKSLIWLMYSTDYRKAHCCGLASSCTS